MLPVSAPDFRSPTSGSAAAAMTPARLAREHDQASWREVPGGGIEVAVRDGNWVQRLRVLDDGSTSLVEGFALRPTAHAEAFVKWAALAAFISFNLSWVFPLSDHRFHTLFGVLFLVALVDAVLMGLYASVILSTWTRRLGSGWNRPTDLNGWVPRSSAQIATVEAIAERHGGRAYVYDQGVEPLVVRASKLFRADYWFVEDDGFSRKQARFLAVDGISDSRRWIQILTRQPGD